MSNNCDTYIDVLYRKKGEGALNHMDEPTPTETRGLELDNDSPEKSELNDDLDDYVNNLFIHQPHDTQSSDNQQSPKEESGKNKEITSKGSPIPEISEADKKYISSSSLPDGGYGDTVKQDAASISGSFNNNRPNFNDDNLWDLNYIFNCYQAVIHGTNGNYNEFEGFDYGLIDEKGNLAIKGSTPIRLIGPLKLVLDAFIREKEYSLWENIVLKKGDKTCSVLDEKKYSVYIIGKGVYVIRISIKFETNDNPKFIVEDVNINFGNIGPSEIANIRGDMSNTEKQADLNRLEIVVKENDKLREDIRIGLFRNKEQRESLESANDSELIKYRTKELQTENARAAIMSRNMSHNIGSHVLSHLHNDLEDSTCSKENAYKQGVSHFVNYIQERQDFIAAIANNDIGTMVPSNFKDDIYDFFNPEYVQKRHPGAKKCENILLHYIAYSEGFQRPLLYGGVPTNTKNIKIIFGKFDGLNDKEGDNREQDGDGASSLEDMRQFNLALPTLGRHAFFSILENIIRNAAKHDNEHIDGNLIVRIDRYDCFSDFSESHSDVDDGGYEGNLALQEIIKTFYIDKDPDDSYHYITITINNNKNCEGSKNLETLDCLRKATIIPFIDENGELNEKSKGIKEIRICASWLRGGVDPITESFPRQEDVGEDDKPGKIDSQWNHHFLKEPPLLFVRLTQHGMLQYIICLRKNKELAYVTNKEVPIAEDDNHEWKAFTPDEYIKIKNSTYRYTVVADDVDYNEIRRHSGCYCYTEKNVGSPVPSWSDGNKRKDYICGLLSFVHEPDDCITIVNGADDSGKPLPLNISEQSKEFIIKPFRAKPIIYGYYHHYNPRTHYNNLQCSVEQLTGHNSTDRLVRHPQGGSLDMMWYYQHLRALKTRVTIIDERLYKRISQAEEKMLGFLDKRLYICNIEIDDKTNKVQFHYCKWEQVIENKNKKRVLKEKVVDLKWSGNELITDDLVEGEFENFKGDLISIHQGILDKMYAAWKVEGDMGRGRLISALYKLLATKHIVIHSGAKSDFLCNFIIHSGRAKPPKNQMPLDLPFVPYSSIERAVMDCKYILVDLLSTARYV